jgi:transposase
MHLKCRVRKKNGKEYRSWSVIESQRIGRAVVQRHVLYLGQINEQQSLAWEKAISVFDETSGQARQLAFYPEGRALSANEVDSIQVRISALTLEHPRQWGACWLANELWEKLKLDEFFSARLGESREGTAWEKVLRVMVTYRLLSPGSEWRLHRQWFGTTALPDLLGVDDRVAQPKTLYRCMDLLLEHKDALFAFLRERWVDLFSVSYDILLYDLTSVYFECDVPEDESDPRKFGYSRDRRSDCVQVVIALVVTPDGLPLAYEMMPGNTSDKTTLAAMIALIQKRHGKANRVWILDRGIPTEETLERMRTSTPPTSYLVGTPKALLNKLEAKLTERPWQEVRAQLRVKFLPTDGEVYALTASGAQKTKACAQLRRQLKKYWKRLRELAQPQTATRAELLVQLGEAAQQAGAAAQLVAVEVSSTGQLSYRLERASVREQLRVKVSPADGEVYVLTESGARITKERSMRRRKLKKYWQRLGELAEQKNNTRDELLVKLGKAEQDAGAAAKLVAVEVSPTGQLSYRLDRAKLREVRRREGRYLLRTNLKDTDPAVLWRYYMQLVFVEEVFRILKGDLSVRPVFHQKPDRIEAHLFIAFLAYCLSITLRQQLRQLASGLMPRPVLDKFATVQMLDVRVPTTDGRELLLVRRTEPDRDVALLLDQLKLTFPAQPPPRIRATGLV